MTEGGQRQIPIERHIPEGMTAVFANHFVVQHTNREFVLSFFQLELPMLIDPTPEEIEDVRSIPAHAVARVVVTPGGLKELIEVLTQNYRKFDGRRKTSAREE